MGILQALLNDLSLAVSDTLSALEIVYLEQKSQKFFQEIGQASVQLRAKIPKMPRLHFRSATNLTFSTHPLSCKFIYIKIFSNYN